MRPQGIYPDAAGIRTGTAPDWGQVQKWVGWGVVQAQLSGKWMRPHVRSGHPSPPQTQVAMCPAGGRRKFPGEAGCVRFGIAADAQSRAGQRVPGRARHAWGVDLKSHQADAGARRLQHWVPIHSGEVRSALLSQEDVQEMLASNMMMANHLRAAWHVRMEQHWTAALEAPQRGKYRPWARQYRKLLRQLPVARLQDAAWQQLDTSVASSCSPQL